MSPATHSDVYTVTLMDRQDVAEGTMAFRFEKPAHFVFTPGQFVKPTLVDPPETDAEGNGRAFSIASAPHEDTLMVATRMRDTAFKRVLRNMPPGATVQMEGPFGNFSSMPIRLTGRFSGRRDWDYPISEHDLPCGGAEAAAPPLPLLFEPATGRCPVPGRTADLAAGRSALHLCRDYDCG